MILATLAFPAAIGLVGLLALNTFDESGAKIAAALKGLSGTSRPFAA